MDITPTHPGKSFGSVKMSDVLISLDFSTAYVDVEKLNAGGHFLFAK